METGVTPRQLITSLVSLVVIFGGLYFVFRYFGLDQVQETIENAGLWAPLILIIAKAATIVIAPLSGSPLYPVGGALFGFWKGTLILLIGDVLGGVVAFFISRIFGRHIVEKLLGKSEEQFLSRALKMMGTVKGFLVARICFMPLPEVVAYGAGLTRIHFVPFILIYSAISIIPIAVLAGAGSVLTMGTWWVLPLAIIGGVIVLPIGFFIFRSMLNEWDQTR